MQILCRNSNTTIRGLKGTYQGLPFDDGEDEKYVGS